MAHYSPWYAKYVLFICCMIYVANQWSRYLISYLYAVSTDGYSEDEAEKISLKEATGISTQEYGLLAGYGFSIFFVLAGLVMGRATDLYVRVNLLTYGTLAWNIGVLVMGLASGFKSLLLSRIVLGAGQSIISPACLSILADYFPKEKRAQASGVYSIGVYLGGGLSSLSIILARTVGWRATCGIVAFVGFALAAVAQATMIEPKRTTLPEVKAQLDQFKKEHHIPSKKHTSSAKGTDSVSYQHGLGVEEEEVVSYGSTKDAFSSSSSSSSEQNNAKNRRRTVGKAVKTIPIVDTEVEITDNEEEEEDEEEELLSFSDSLLEVLDNRVVLLVLLGAAVRNIALYLIMYYLPLFYEEAFPDYNDAFSIANALVVAVCGSLSSFYGGFLADSWETKGNPAARIDVPLIGCLFAFPLFILTLISKRFYTSIILLAIHTLFAECWCGPIMSLQQNILPSRSRGLGYAIFAFIVVFTAATATWIFGIVLAHESTENIKTWLLIAVCSSYLGASIFFYVSRNAWLKQQQQQALSQAPFQTMDTSSSSCPTSSAGTAFSSLTQWVADDSTTTDKHAYQPISSREEEEDFDL